jgi:GT2 family glycosyltransferase
MSARVLISIVTHNSARYLKTCLESIKVQTCADFSISVWDNASEDGTASIIEDYRDILGDVHFSKSNLGFCAAHNRLILPSLSEYNLVLNPDIMLDTRFLEIMLREMERDPSAGSATGKLWRWQAESANLEDFFIRHQSSPRILDTTGIYFTPTQRHFDRGSGETDAGQYDRREYVFGASGAAAFYRRAMLQDIADGSRYFDENFFAYREDADLAWRAQWMGWHCLYIPEATGYHARRVLPERRASLPDAINMHSFKNRFLLRIKNMDLVTYACFFVPITLRDIATLVYVLIRERSSLSAIPLLRRASSQTWAMRKSLQGRRRASAREIRSWFSYRPVAKPIPDA